MNKRQYLADICKKIDYPDLAATITGIPDAELNTAIPYVM